MRGIDPVVRHREQLPFAPPLAYAAVVAVILGFLAFGIVGPIALGNAGERGPGYFLALGGVALIVFLAARWFALLTVEAGPGGLVAAFGPFRRRIPLDRIEDARPAAYAWIKHGGWGWRFAPGREALSVLTTRNGIELLVRTRRGRTRTVFVSCREPERALEALRSSA